MNQKVLSKIALALLAGGTAVNAADRKPNFLFVYTDDQRWDAVGVVQREQGERARFPWFKTPNMDRLASEGVRFRNAFVTHSLCSPSRAAFLTGRYNHLNGVFNNDTRLPDGSVTHAELLRKAGYRTAYFGKWHMGEQRGKRPGFDYSASFVGQGKYQDCPFEIDGVSTPTKGWVDDVSTAYAVDWMKQNRDKPFSMVLGFKSPHTKRGGDNLPDRLRNLYEGETNRPAPNMGAPAIFHLPVPEGGMLPHRLAGNGEILDYLRHIAGADDNLGKLLNALDELGLAEDTVVVYSSDNGYFLGEHGLGDKRALYEESIRIPMIARYPRAFPAGSIVDKMVLNIDLLPTFLDMAGAVIPGDVQGASWKNLAEGKAPDGWRSSFLMEYYKELGDTPTCVGVRTDTAKLVRYKGRPEWTECFDLEADPYELNNIAADSAVTAELSLELNRLMKEVAYTEVPKRIRRVVPAKGVNE